MRHPSGRTVWDVRRRSHVARTNGTTRGARESTSNGHLLWVTPGGIVREVDPDDAEPVPAPCPSCAGEEAIRVLAREHRTCGHVTLDGFDGGAACPKCGETTGTFPVISTVLTCRTCGYAIGSPA